MSSNLDSKTVEGFGAEWSKFDQSELEEAEHQQIFESYFSIFPWDALPKGSIGFDLGCGSGRWAKKVAQKVGKLICIDASEDALEVAKRNLSSLKNCEFYNASVAEMPIEENSMDFGYSLGVLHHIPDTQKGISACVSKVKPGAPFLVYLYYAFDNRPAWFRALWKISDVVRKGISSLPTGVKHLVAELIAFTVYLPLARFALVAEKLGIDVSAFPLSIYRDKTIYTMRTDSLDRFGTRLEQRFTKNEIDDMMKAAGLEDIRFSAEVPFWCAVGTKK